MAMHAHAEQLKKSHGGRAAKDPHDAPPFWSQVPCQFSELLPDSGATNLKKVKCGSSLSLLPVLGNLSSEDVPLVVPKGPDGLYALAQWLPTTLLDIWSQSPTEPDAHQASLRRRRAECFMQEGVCLHTDFSGKGSVEHAFRMFAGGVEEPGCSERGKVGSFFQQQPEDSFRWRALGPLHNACSLWLCPGCEELELHVPEGWLYLHSACDTSPVCREVLQRMGVEHVFGDVLQYLPADAQRTLEGLRPVAGASHASKVNAHQVQRTFLQSKSEYFFCKGATAKCLCHSDQELGCPVVCPQTWDGTMPSPWKVNFSGPMCTPWSRLGRCEGEGDSNMESFHVWMQKVQREDLQLVFIENAEGFPWTLFESEMPNYYCCRSIFSPEDWPLRSCSIFVCRCCQQILLR